MNHKITGKGSIKPYNHPFSKALKSHSDGMTKDEYHDYVRDLNDAAGTNKYAARVVQIIQGNAIPIEDEVRFLAGVVYGSDSQEPGRKLVEDGLDFIQQMKEQQAASPKAIDPAVIKGSRGRGPER